MIKKKGCASLPKQDIMDILMGSYPCLFFSLFQLLVGSNYYSKNLAHDAILMH